MSKPKKASKKPTARVQPYGVKPVPRPAVIGMIAAWAVIGILTGVFLISRGSLSQLGSKASLGKATLEVTNVQYDAVGTQPYLAPPGLKFAIATVKVTNGSSDIFNFAPVLQTKVIDELGQEWSMAPATMEKPIQAGPFPSTATRTGTLSFLVPVNSKSVTFVFDPLVPNGITSKYILGQN